MAMGNYNFEWTTKFCYLGSLLNSENTIIDKISKGVVEGSKAYYTNCSLMKSLLLLRNVKRKL